MLLVVEKIYANIESLIDHVNIRIVLYVYYALYFVIITEFEWSI